MTMIMNLNNKFTINCLNDNLNKVSIETLNVTCIKVNFEICLIK